MSAWLVQRATSDRVALRHPRIEQSQFLQLQTPHSRGPGAPNYRGQGKEGLNWDSWKVAENLELWLKSAWSWNPH